MPALLDLVQTTDRLVNQLQQNVRRALVGYPTVTQAVRGLVASAGQLLGTNTNDAAVAGNVGELLRAYRVRASAVSLTSGTVANIATTGGTSLTLTAGDWDLRGVVGFRPNAAASVTVFDAAVSATSAALPAGAALGVPTNGEFWLEQSYAAMVPGNGNDLYVALPPFGVQVAINTTKKLYLVADATFTGGGATVTAYGFLEARRVR